MIEGVMGLFDGFGYDDESGSTARWPSCSVRRS